MNGIHTVAFSPDGKRIVLATGRDRTRVLDVESMKELHRWEPARHCNFSPDGKKIVLATDQGKIRILDVESGEELRVFRQMVFGGTPDHVNYVAFSADGTKIISGHSRTV